MECESARQYDRWDGLSKSDGVSEKDAEMRGPVDSEIEFGVGRGAGDRRAEAERTGRGAAHIVLSAAEFLQAIRKPDAAVRSGRDPSKIARRIHPALPRSTGWGRPHPAAARSIG